MSKKVLILGKVENGKLSESTLRKLAEKEVDFEGNIVLTIEKETRTLLQNALAWAYMMKVSLRTGYTKEEAWALTKEALNAQVVTWTDHKTGEITEKRIVMDTHNMPKDKFAELLDRIPQFWAEQDVDLESPEEYYNRLSKSDDHE